MARYRGPSVRLMRRSGRDLQLKSPGSRAAGRFVPGTAVPPGQHGASASRKQSTYGLQLREKQALRWTYGVLEKQFRKYAETAKHLRGVAGLNLLQLLERRLDNVVFRAGFAVTRAQARQFVLHNHITVNGKRVNIPSLLLRTGDVIAVAEASKEVKPIAEAIASRDQRTAAPWVDLNLETLEAKFLTFPSREDLQDLQINEQLVIEFYSR